MAINSIPIDLISRVSRFVNVLIAPACSVLIIVSSETSVCNVLIFVNVKLISLDTMSMPNIAFLNSSPSLNIVSRVTSSPSRSAKYWIISLVSSDSSLEYDDTCSSNESMESLNESPINVAISLSITGLASVDETVNSFDFTTEKKAFTLSILGKDTFEAVLGIYVYEVAGVHLGLVDGWKKRQDSTRAIYIGTCFFKHNNHHSHRLTKVCMSAMPASNALTLEGS
jgi:hypothetical protein